MIEQQFLAVLLYLIKTTLIFRELIQNSSLGSKILVGFSPGVQDVPAAVPWCLPQPRLQMDLQGELCRCALGVSCVHPGEHLHPGGSPGRASDSPSLLFGCKGHLSLFKLFSLSCSLPSGSLCFSPHQFFVRVFQ